jgi:hypothetical protein
LRPIRASHRKSPMTRRGSISPASIRFVADKRGQYCTACPRLITSKRFGDLCCRCQQHQFRWSDPRQPIVNLATLQPYIKQIEGVLRRNPQIDVEALTERWKMVVAEATATAVYCQSHTHVSTEQWAAVAIRDFGENMPHERALVIVAAAHLQREADEHSYVSDTAFNYVVINVLRRCSGSGRRWHTAPAGGRMKTTRRGLNKETRARVWRYLSSGLGGAAVGLAQVEITRLREIAAKEMKYRAAAEALSVAI